jgi:hypothetical protein
MPQARQWTETADKVIYKMRGSGETWAEIGRALGLSRNTVIERGRRLRAEAPVRQPMVLKEDNGLDDPSRPPLPAGHRLTWGLLTTEPYPTGDNI